jgi:hypothetical protein
LLRFTRLTRVFDGQSQTDSANDGFVCARYPYYDVFLRPVYFSRNLRYDFERFVPSGVLPIQFDAYLIELIQTIEGDVEKKALHSSTTRGNEIVPRAPAALQRKT